MELTGEGGGKTDGQCQSSRRVGRSSVPQNLLKVAHRSFFFFAWKGSFSLVKVSLRMKKNTCLVSTLFSKRKLGEKKIWETAVKNLSLLSALILLRTQFRASFVRQEYSVFLSWKPRLKQ